MALHNYVKNFAGGGPTEEEAPEGVTASSEEKPQTTGQESPLKSKVSKESETVANLASNPQQQAARDARLRTYYEKQLADAKMETEGFGAFTGISAALAKHALSPEGQYAGARFANATTAAKKQEAAATEGLSGLDTMKANIGTHTKFIGLLDEANAAEAAGDITKANALKAQAAQLDPTRYGATSAARKLEMAQSAYGKRLQDSGTLPGTPEFKQKMDEFNAAEINKLNAEASKANKTTSGIPEGTFDQKTGNFIAPGGTVIKATEISKDRAARAKAVDEAIKFNKITDKDISNAVSLLDVTGAGMFGDTAKSIAGAVSEDTLAAQNKIYHKALDGLIAALPPGPASDKDVKNARATFPGFSSEKALRQWLNGLKGTIERSHIDMDNKYGDPKWYGASGAPTVPVIRDFETKQGKKSTKQAAEKPAIPAASKGAVELPPAELLKVGVKRKLSDGNWWTLDAKTGKPVVVPA